MTKTEMRAARYAEEVGICKKSFEYGAEYMLARVLDFMCDFQDGNGEFPLWNYIGNVRKAMEE